MGKKEHGEIKIQLLSSLDTALQLCLLKHLDDINTEDDMLYMVQVFVMMKNVNYSTMPNKSSTEAPIKPVTSDVTRRANKAAKKARQRVAKYETAAAVEIGESVQNTNQDLRGYS